METLLETDELVNPGVTTEYTYSKFMEAPLVVLNSTQPFFNDLVETARDGGGYGGGGYGSGGYGGYGLSTDAVTILSLLTLGALVIQSLISLATTASAGRSTKWSGPLSWVSEFDDWVPEKLVEFARNVDSESLRHVRFLTGSLWSVRRLGSLQEAKEKRNDCLRRVLCEYNLSIGKDKPVMKSVSEIVLLAAASWYGDTAASTYLDTIRGVTKNFQPEDIERYCQRTTALCPPSQYEKAKKARFSVEQILALFGL